MQYTLGLSISDLFLRHVQAMWQLQARASIWCDIAQSINTRLNAQAKIQQHVHLDLKDATDYKEGLRMTEI